MGEAPVGVSLRGQDIRGVAFSSEPGGGGVLGFTGEGGGGGAGGEGGGGGGGGVPEDLVERAAGEGAVGEEVVEGGQAGGDGAVGGGAKGREVGRVDLEELSAVAREELHGAWR